MILKQLTEIKNYPEDLMRFLKELALIPAPSGAEVRRAAFCLAYLHSHSVMQAYIDEVGNVCIPFDLDAGGPLTVIMAHSDTVFGEKTELTLTEDDTWINCPAIGDNTVHIAALIQYAIWLTACPPGRPFLFVINVGEEGLGNLRGSREIVKRYGARIGTFITFDSVTNEVVTKAVGSVRFEVTVGTTGGHSFRDFGKPNAILLMSDLIGELKAAMTETLAAVPVQDPQIRASWNIGRIEGGTSVNTIAPSASMLFECRSDDYETLSLMRGAFEKTVNQFAGSAETGGRSGIVESGRCAGNADGPEDTSSTAEPPFKLQATLIGERPCMKDVDPVRHTALIELAEDVIRRHYKEAPVRTSGSTDANIALSEGIPAICFGLCRGEGAHTIKERIRKDSLLPGLRAGWDFILRL